MNRTNASKNGSIIAICIAIQFLLVCAYPSGYTLIGDMLFTQVEGEGDEDQRAGAFGIIGRNQSLTWVNNRIPYEMHSSITKNPKFHKRVITAMDDIMKAVPNCIHFEPKGNDDKYWLRVQNVDEKVSNCYSEVGFRSKSPQIIELRPRCPQGTFVHELLHTIGYLHEHTRNDRDDYVEVDWGNIYNRFRVNFIVDNASATVKPAYDTSYYGVPYNYESIMHYPLSGGNTAINSEKPVMLHKNNKTGLGYNKEPGQRYYLSHGDLIMIANKHECTMPNINQYELTDATSSSNADFEALGGGPMNDYEEPLQIPEDLDLTLELKLRFLNK